MVGCIRNFIVAGVFILLVAPAFAQVVRKPAPPNDPVKRKEAADRWLKEGRDSLGAGAYEAARDRFSDVLDIDSKNPLAQHGLALAYVGLADFKRAQGAIQGAFDAEVRAGGIGKLGKPLLINYAMVMISAKEPMRAVKALTDYQRLAGKPDEAVLNALAVALNTVDPAARKTLAYSSSARFYDEQNAKLEATRPGEKRWGIAWRSASDFQQFSAMWTADLTELETLYTQLLRKSEELVAAQHEHDRAQLIIDKFGFVPPAMPSLRQTLASTQDQYDVLASSYQTKSERIRKPALPVTMSAIPMDAGSGEALAALVIPADPTGVASATPERRPVRRPRTVAANVPADGAPTSAPVVVKPETPQVVAPTQSATPEMIVPRVAGKRTVMRPAAAVAITPDLLLTSATEVIDAKDIQVTTLAGVVSKGTVLRSDANLGLALIKVEGAKLLHAQVGDVFRGGTVQCVSLAPSIFQPVAEIIPGSVKISGVEWTLSLQRAPKRAGSPILSANKIVGIELGDRSTELTKIPVVTLDALRQFCAEELALAKGPFGNPNEVLCELLVTSEVE